MIIPKGGMGKWKKTAGTITTAAERGLNIEKLGREHRPKSHQRSL